MGLADYKKSRILTLYLFLYALTCGHALSAEERDLCVTVSEIHEGSDSGDILSFTVVQKSESAIGATEQFSIYVEDYAARNADLIYESYRKGVALYLTVSGTEVKKILESCPPLLEETQLFLEIAKNCHELDLSSWSHPTKTALSESRVSILSVKLCNDNKYPIFFVKLPVDLIYHSGDDVTMRYIERFWKSLMKANGYWPFALVDVEGDLVIYVTPEYIDAEDKYYPTTSYETFRIAVAANADAVCQSDPDVSPQCRYPAGDSWCRDNAPNRPYAFPDSCMRESGHQASTQSAVAWDRCAERAEASVDYDQVGMSGINRAVLDACGPRPGSAEPLPAATADAIKSYDECAAGVDFAATLLRLNDPTGRELWVMLKSVGASSVDELVQKKCGSRP